MPRRSGGGGMRRPSPPPSRPAPRAPAPAPTPTPAPAAAPSAGPGLFGQMAATAGGVAIGSAVGHAVGHAFTGGSGGGEQAPVQQQAPVPAAGQQPCEFEMRAFLDCSQRSGDLAACEAFNTQLKECRARYGM